MLTLADVIFPAFYLPYVAQLLMPVAALAGLAAEVLVYRWWAKDQPLGRLIAMVIVVNFASSAVGIAIASLMPAGYSSRFVLTGQGPWHDRSWENLATIGWCVAFVVSVLIEAVLIRILRALVRIPRPLLASLFANASSYVVLLLLLVAHGLMS